MLINVKCKMNLLCNACKYVKLLGSKILKLVGLSGKRRGDQVLTNVMRLLESGGTSKDRRWEYGKQIAHFCRILGRFFGTKWKTAGKEGYCSLRGNDSRQVLLSKRQNMTPLPFLQKKKRKKKKKKKKNSLFSQMTQCRYLCGFSAFS